jgi:hypothetical protein
MAYTYKYIPASMTITGKTPKQEYVDTFQESLNQQFYNASDWWTIQEETAVGSQEYEDIDVRIEGVINAETGLKLGDDWKTVLFKDITHDISLGKHYTFDNNTWLTINTEILKNLAATCTIRRCNNTLRWVDEATGVYYEEPGCIEYLIKEPRNYATGGSPFITPGGFLKIETQFNDRTKLINQNQRFLFGNVNHWTCYKIIGTGINDYKNATTYDNNSAKVLSLDLVADFVNEELDDVQNGIANVGKSIYVITVNPPSAEGAVGGSLQLSANVIYNGDSVTRPLTWETSDVHFATVSSTGMVTFVANGTCTITVGIEGNPVHADCAITVKASPAVNSYIVITPDENYVLEGLVTTYAVYLYENGAEQSDTFTITCNSAHTVDGHTYTVPANSYSFSQTNGNHFMISNRVREMDAYFYLTVTCTTGSIVKTIDIYLRGAWQYDNA